MTVGFTVSVDFTGIVENEPEEVSEYTYGAPEFVPGPVLPEVVEPAVSRVQAPPLDPVSARSKIVSRSAMLSSCPAASGGRDRNHKSVGVRIAVIISDGVRDGGRASACRRAGYDARRRVERQSCRQRRRRVREWRIAAGPGRESLRVGRAYRRRLIPLTSSSTNRRCSWRVRGSHGLCWGLVRLSGAGW